MIIIISVYFVTMDQRWNERRGRQSTTIAMTIASGVVANASSSSPPLSVRCVGGSARRAHRRCFEGNRKRHNQFGRQRLDDAAHGLVARRVKGGGTRWNARVTHIPFSSSYAEPTTANDGSRNGDAEEETGGETAAERVVAFAADWTKEKMSRWEPPKFLWRTAATALLFGSVLFRMIREPKRVNWEQTIQQIARVGPQTLGVSLLTSSFVGMVFTIQFCKEFAKVGLKNAIGGLLGLAFARELTPVICAIVLTGRIGSSIAAELGTMQVTEQVDQLTVLGTDPVDYLVIPRVIACALSLPILSLISFAQSLAASIFLADLRYGVTPNVIIDSAAKYLEPSDIGIMTAKSIAFGAVIAVISCGWGTTTTGGAKGVGESTTASVVISLTAIFVVDFVLSLIFFNK